MLHPQCNHSICPYPFTSTGYTMLLFHYTVENDIRVVSPRVVFFFHFGVYSGPSLSCLWVLEATPSNIARNLSRYYCKTPFGFLFHQRQCY